MKRLSLDKSQTRRWGGLIAAGLLACSLAANADEHAKFTVVEASIAEMQAAMASGETSSEAIVQAYLERIDR